MCKHFTVSVIAITLLVIGISYPILAKGPLRNDPPYHQLDVANPTIHHLIQDRSNVWMTVHNWGFLGDNYEAFYLEIASMVEFPGGSGVQYMGQGALWVGALIVEDDFEYPRVSTGMEGWNRGQHEMYPGESLEDGVIERSNIPFSVNCQGENMYSPHAVAPQELTATYTDTLTEQFWVENDPSDGPHVPLGIKIRQKSMSWDSYGFDDYIIFQYTIENIGENLLKNPYFGLFITSGAGIPDSSYTYYEDDLVGFLNEHNGEPINIAYTADNDGRPPHIQSGNDFTVPGIAGTKALLPHNLPIYESFNWWESHPSPAIDYGPAWESHVDSFEWMGFWGTPSGDLRKYLIMTNRELDFDQVYVNDPDWIASHPQHLTDPFTGESYEEPWHLHDLVDPENLANGAFTRHLHSWGPLGENVAPAGQEPETYLYPGDSCTFTLAFICGDNFHDVNNPQPSNENIDPSLFDFDDLAYNASKAQFMVDNDFQIIPPYAPDNLRILDAAKGSITVAWTWYRYMPGVSVYLYRRTEGGEFGTTPINIAPAAGYKYTDTDIEFGVRYYYKAQAVRYDSLLSWFSDETSFVAGAPLPLHGLEAESSHNGYVPLSWDPCRKDNCQNYVVYRKDSATDYQVVGSPDVPHFSDTTAINAVEYTYAVTVINNPGLESEMSDTVTATPMGFYEDLIVVMYLTESNFMEWASDTLITYYHTLFEDIGETTEFVFLSGYLDFPNLADISPYGTLWMIDDTRQNRSGLYEHWRARNVTLETYIDLGGNVVISGRKLFVGQFSSQIGYTPVVNLPDLIVDYFAVENAWGDSWPHYNTWPVGFVAALPAIPDYLPLEIDSAKVEALQGIVTHPPLEVDGMVPTSDGETFYTYVSSYPDSSDFHGYATAIRYDSTTSLITFPLYVMAPYESVMDMAEKVLEYVRGESFQGVEEPPDPLIPEDYVLHQNYPNPFNANTIVPFALPIASKVNLTVYNIIGQKVMTVADGWYDAGIHRVFFDGTKLASGVYFYQLKAGNFVNVKKMVLLK